jgi:tetratricopeptide (TPR) repeat protein
MKDDIPPQTEESFLQNIQEYRRRCEENSQTYLFFPLAEAYRKIGRLEEAISACREALEKHPDYWEVRVMLGKIYKEHARTDEAKRQLELAVDNLPNNFMANKLLGDIYLSEEQDEKAIECYRRIMNYYPECSNIDGLLKQMEEKERLYQENLIRELENWRKGIHGCLGNRQR